MPEMAETSEHHGEGCGGGGDRLVSAPGQPRIRLAAIMRSSALS
jgi:hypothetical protein